MLVEAAHVRFLQDLTGDNVKDNTEHVKIQSEAILSIWLMDKTGQFLLLSEDEKHDRDAI